jgi:hypothetical protein
MTGCAAPQSGKSSGMNQRRQNFAAGFHYFLVD